MNVRWHKITEEVPDPGTACICKKGDSAFPIYRVFVWLDYSPTSPCYDENYPWHEEICDEDYPTDYVDFWISVDELESVIEPYQ